MTDQDPLCDGKSLLREGTRSLCDGESALCNGKRSLCDRDERMWGHEGMKR